MTRDLFISALQPDLHKLTHAAVTAYKRLQQLKELARLDCKFPTLPRPVRTPATNPGLEYGDLAPTAGLAVT